ncbi:Lipoxygenase, C-terminal [Dillenia turbinata]|uniref:Peroxidase n=1 Tax=Dillenia turbinata TaxID=194707 RepID=A0AAN8URB4_9MAGN
MGFYSFYRDGLILCSSWVWSGGKWRIYLNFEKRNSSSDVGCLSHWTQAVWKIKRMQKEWKRGMEGSLNSPLRIILLQISPSSSGLPLDSMLLSTSGEPDIQEAFYKFSMEIKMIEKEIEKRNADPYKRKRCGAGSPPYKLLRPSSERGTTCRGVPDSITGFLHPCEVHIVGYARTKISDDEHRDGIRGYLLHDKDNLDLSVEVSEFLIISLNHDRVNSESPSPAPSSDSSAVPAKSNNNSMPNGENFDAHFYKNLLKGKGLVFSDQQLTLSAITPRIGRAYASDEGGEQAFRRDFARAMIKLSNLNVLTAR